MNPKKKLSAFFKHNPIYRVTSCTFMSAHRLEKRLSMNTQLTFSEVLLLLISFYSSTRRRKWWLKFTKNWKFMFDVGTPRETTFQAHFSSQCLGRVRGLSVSISKFPELLRPERHKLDDARNSNHFRKVAETREKVAKCSTSDKRNLCCRSVE